MQSDRRIFINEHLSEEIYALIKEALLMKKNRKVVKVMVKHGKGWEKIMTTKGTARSIKIKLLN